MYEIRDQMSGIMDQNQDSFNQTSWDQDQFWVVRDNAVLCLQDWGKPLTGALLELYLFFPKSLQYNCIYISASQKFNDLKTGNGNSVQNVAYLRDKDTGSLSLKEKSSSC